MHHERFYVFLLSFCLSVYLCKTGAKTALLTLMRNGCLCGFEVANHAIYGT